MHIRKKYKKPNREVRYYHHEVNHYRQTKKWKRKRKLITAIVSLVVILLIIVVVDSLLQYLESNRSSKFTAKTSEAYTIPVKTFTTQFFQFQAGLQWQPILKETTATKYVYRAVNGGYVEHEFTVYVNDKTPASFEATRTLPVTISSDKVSPKFISNHCKEGFPKIASHFPRTITYSGVQFTCNPDSNNYDVVAGVSGGNTNIVLNRPKGGSITFGFTYRNLMGAADGAEARKILNSFKTL